MLRSLLLPQVQAAVTRLLRKLCEPTEGVNSLVYHLVPNFLFVLLECPSAEVKLAALRALRARATFADDPMWPACGLRGAVVTCDNMMPD